MWAWLRTTASISLAGNGKVLLRANDSARLPWKSPQSSRIFCRPASTRCIEPVTVCAAPQNVTVTDMVAVAPLTKRSAQDRIDHLAIAKRDRPIQSIVNLKARIDAEAVIDRGGK